uniref:Glycosyl hydrolase family 13 catalytic domain-containing protein n=1 Tax=Timema tahoe TaxID=61484 RepID=A0A7R9FFR0_9NEOP|nr:unnamed protein product [Timema tahoe]
MNVSESGMMSLTLPRVGIDPNCPSPVNEFIADEEAASICPLLTPSPPTSFDHPLSLINPSPGMAYEQEISPSSTDNMEIPTRSALNGNNMVGYSVLNQEILDQANNEGSVPTLNATSSVHSVMESSSSSSSVLQEPTVCAQLLSSHHYHHLTKASNIDPFTCQESGGKPPLSGLQLAVTKSTSDFCFLSWNWPVIRKLSFWGVVSLLMACACVVVALIAQLPSQCNPPHSWWQGTLFYEIFPASFQDSSNFDGIGDLRGLLSRVQYLDSLGVQAVRLNPIFPSKQYPESYDTPTSLTGINPHLGTEQDFTAFVEAMHKHNMSIVLDLPIHPYFKQLLTAAEKDKQKEAQNKIIIASKKIHLARKNGSDQDNFTENLINSLIIPPLVDITRAQDKMEDTISNTLRYWLRRGVDGFYIKGLEYFTDDPDFASQIRNWKKIVNSFSAGLDDERILMCSVSVLDTVNESGDSNTLRAVLNNIDLIDIHLDLFGNGTESVKKQVDKVIQGILYTKPGYPWVHWNFGSVDTQRLSTHLISPNGSLGAILFHMMLPGTPSIFYGDEIGLKDIQDSQGERKDISHLHQLAPMHWIRSDKAFGFTPTEFHPWLPFSDSWSYIEAGKQSALKDIARLRDVTPPVYMNGVYKDGENLPNCEIRTLHPDIIVMERMYPRRNSYVVVSNFGSETQVRDLSSLYYGGEVVADLRGRVGQYVTFQTLLLYPGESIVVKLDKYSSPMASLVLTDSSQLTSDSQHLDVYLNFDCQK